MKLTIQKRGSLYNQSEFGEKFPDSRFMISDRWISATWIMGNNYRNPSGYYGSYPPAFLARMRPMFPDAKTVLHLFSGSLTKADVKEKGKIVKRLDRRKELKPDFVGEAEEMPSAFDKDRIFDLVYADPPYSKEDAEHYGCCLVNKKKVLAACYDVMSDDGILVWMDQSLPMYRKDMFKWVGVISIYRSTNHRIRGVLLFQKQ